MKQKIPTIWNLSDLGKKYNDPLFIKERNLHKRKIISFAKKWKQDTRYLKNIKKLKEALDEYNELSHLSDREGMYLFLMRQVDSGNKDLIAAEKKYIDFSQKLADEIRFFSLSLGTIKKTEQKIFLKSPVLKEYWHFLKGIFETAKYQLSEQEEKILSLKSGVSHGNWTAMVSEIFARESAEVLVKGEKGRRVKEVKTFHEILALLQSDCKRVRKSAVKAIKEILKKHEFVVEKEFNSILENKKINDQLRGYSRPDEARILSDDISFAVVDTLSDVVADFYFISQQFYTLKAKLLKQDKLHYHERNVPLGKLKKEYSYEEAVSLVEDVFTAFDGDFANIFKSMYQSGKIDVFPRAGKRGGAFCMYYGKNEPVYIMLNHTNKSNDVMTLAHEMGHAIHGTLAKQEMALYYDTPMFMAETASTFCEGLVFEKMLKEVNEKERLFLLMEKIGDTVSTIMRQIAAYRFEKEIHTLFRKKAYLSRDEIGKIFKKHMSAYMGKSVLQDDDAEKWWMYWSHFRSPFYVYSYASGLLMANGMHALLKQNPNSWKKIKNFFFTGASKSPEQVFKEMGIDIKKRAFWEAGLRDVEKMLNEAKRLAKKLGKI